MTDTINIYDAAGLQLAVQHAAINLNNEGNSFSYTHGSTLINVEYLYAELDSSTLTISLIGTTQVTGVKVSGQTCGALSKTTWDINMNTINITTPLSPGQQVDWEFDFEGPRPTIPLKVKIRRR